MRRVLALLCLLPALAWGADDPARLPYRGEPGALPVQVVLQFLGRVLGQDGKFDYRSLKILQDSHPPGFDRASLTVIRDGVSDPVLRGLRHRFVLSRDGAVWTILTLEQDFSCRNRPAWGTKPCP